MNKDKEFKEEGERLKHWVRDAIDKCDSTTHGRCHKARSIASHCDGFLLRWSGWMRANGLIDIRASVKELAGACRLETPVYQVCDHCAVQSGCSCNFCNELLDGGYVSDSESGAMWQRIEGKANDFFKAWEAFDKMK